MSSTISLSFILATFFALILLANGNPIDALDENDIVVCPEGTLNGLIEGVIIYPKETRCSMVGGMCVESNKCQNLVSAKGLCPINAHRGVECCFELEPAFLPCPGAELS